MSLPSLPFFRFKAELPQKSGEFARRVVVRITAIPSRGGLGQAVGSGGEFGGVTFQLFRNLAAWRWRSRLLSFHPPHGTS